MRKVESHCLFELGSFFVCVVNLGLGFGRLLLFHLLFFFLFFVAVFSFFFRFLFLILPCLRLVNQQLGHLIHLVHILALEAPGRPHLLINVRVPRHVRLQNRDTLEKQTEPLREEGLNALYIAFEVELSIRVTGAHALGKINDGDLFLLGDHQIEFVVVTVDETVFG